MYMQLINGATCPEQVSTPVDALQEFYYAFNTGDLKVMASNWAAGSEIAMSNPLGGIKRGWDEIGAVYQRIFTGPARVYVEFYDYQLFETDLMFCVAGRERGHMDKGGERLDLAIRTSRIFRHLDGRWRQVHHHGSIDSPELLEAYQTAVLAPEK